MNQLEMPGGLAAHWLSQKPLCRLNNRKIIRFLFIDPAHLPVAKTEVTMRSTCFQEHSCRINKP
jgi:hypothetical protein